jgi:glutamate-5-semialdehyde dehydrogenase
MMNLRVIADCAKGASVALAKATTEQKNRALLTMAAALETHAEAILAANRRDLEAAESGGMTPAFIDRLNLEGRLHGIAADVRAVAALPDPVGQTFAERTLENGLRVSKRRTPLGVLGIIYESRPNVTVDCAALALKSGNAAILRGGKETFHSNTALVAVLRDALSAAGLPADAIQYIDSIDREHVKEMLKLHDSIDMIIPRGGAALHQFCREHSTIPVMIGGIGVCHIYVDESADLDQALAIIRNAKVQRPSVCNSVDTALVNGAVAETFLPRLVAHLRKDGVTFRAAPRAFDAIPPADDVLPASEADFDTEWMALILSLQVVDGLDDALAHIRRHSTGHSEAILTRNDDHARRFVEEIDSSAVFVNASTRFNDGGQLGLGAEIAVSTQKLHARGPMGLEELTTYKWVVIGDGQIRPDA